MTIYQSLEIPQIPMLYRIWCIHFFFSSLSEINTTYGVDCILIAAEYIEVPTPYLFLLKIVLHGGLEYNFPEVTSKNLNSIARRYAAMNLWTMLSLKMLINLKDSLKTSSSISSSEILIIEKYVMYPLL